MGGGPPLCVKEWGGCGVQRGSVLFVRREFFSPRGPAYAFARSPVSPQGGSPRPVCAVAWPAARSAGPVPPPHVSPVAPCALQSPRASGTAVAAPLLRLPLFVAIVGAADLPP